MATTAVNIAASIYLRRFDIEAPDNLLAPKQVTQVHILKGAVNSPVVAVAVAAALMTSVGAAIGLSLSRPLASLRRCLTILLANRPRAAADIAPR